MGNLPVLDGEILTPLEKYRNGDYYSMRIYTKDLDNIINMDKNVLGDEYYSVIICFSRYKYVNTYVEKYVRVHGKIYKTMITLDNNSRNFRIDYNPFYCRYGKGYNVNIIYPKIEFFKNLPKYDFLEALERLEVF